MAARMVLLTALGLVALAAGANPIRKVVTMLQAMQKKVEAEATIEKAMFDKFMCYCKNSGGDLGGSIAAAEAKGPQVTADIEEGESKQVQLKADLKTHKADRASAKKSIAEATALRKKQAGEFAEVNGDAQTNVAALGKAIAALEKGMAGSFLQTQAAQAIRKIAVSMDMSDADRQEVLSFLSGGAQYAPQSGEITGILKQMKEEMEKDLAAATASENEAIGTFKELVAAKTKEINALTAAIEDKSTRSGELAVAIVHMKEDLSDTAAALEEDKQFLADLETNCATKKGEWDEICKTRAEEMVALAETIKVLNDDDALELFKKTLPGASSSFMQLTQSAGALRQRALVLLRAAANNKFINAKLDFIALALHGKKIGFGKVIKMIDDMVALLKKEQGDDDDKKKYCLKQFDALDDKKKGLERAVSDSGTSIEEAEGALATLVDEIKALEAGIAALDASVAAATKQRKEENEEFVALKASDSAAKEVLGFAKNRLNKFYNPDLYIAPPKRSLSREDQIVVGMGGELVATAPPGGIAGTGISLVQVARHEVAPPPPPETAGAYQKKGEESNGVIAMIDLLVADLDKELTEAATAEKDAQADYEKAMADAAKKRALDSKTLTAKVSAKSDVEGDLQAHKDALAEQNNELMATHEVISGLHGECDWLLQNFAARAAARDGEIDSLAKAKAVLSGADYSLLQTRRTLRGN